MLTTERLFIEKFTPEEIPELMKIEHAPDNCKLHGPIRRKNMKRNLMIQKFSPLPLKDERTGI